MSFVSRFLVFFRGLFGVMSRTTDETTDAPANSSPPSDENKNPDAGSATKEFLLSAGELRGIQRFQRRRGMNSEVAVVQLAIVRLEELFIGGKKKRYSFTIPPPVKHAEAWKFSVGPKSEARLRALLTRLGIRDENTVIRIAVRDLLADSRIEV